MVSKMTITELVALKQAGSRGWLVMRCAGWCFKQGSRACSSRHFCLRLAWMHVRLMATAAAHPHQLCSSRLPPHAPLLQAVESQLAKQAMALAQLHANQVGWQLEGCAVRGQ